MITDNELRTAAEVMYRLIFDDESLWDALPGCNKNQLIDSMAQEIPNMVSDAQRTQLRAIVALAIHQSKLKGTT